MKRFLFNHQLCLHLTLRSIATYMQKSSSHFFHVTIVTYACALPEPHLFQGSAPFWSRFVLYVIACIGTRFSETLPLNPTQLHRNVALAQSTCEFLSLRKETLLNTGCLWKLMGLSISPYNYYSQHIVCALCLRNVVICVPHNDLKKTQLVRLCDRFWVGQFNNNIALLEDPYLLTESIFVYWYRHAQERSYEREISVDLRR